MRTLAKKSQAVLVLTLVLASILLNASTAHSTEFSAPNRVLLFLTDVVGLNITRYNATLVSNDVTYPSDLLGIPQESGKFTFESEESKIDVTYSFKNKTLVWLNLYVLKGSPLYAKPQPVKIIDEVKDFLERYQVYVGASYVQTMRSMLDSVTEIKAMNVTSGNLKFTMSVKGNYVQFGWMYTANGLDYKRKGTYIHFENGHLRHFGDGWNLYRVGSDRVDVSMDEAIAIARNATKEMPLLYGKVGGEIVSVQPRVADSPVEAKLTVDIKEPLTLYPLWHVQLYFDRVYGNYYGVAVDIWADTGEIRGMYGTGVMGYIPSNEKPQQTQTQPPTQNPTQQTSPQEPAPTQTPPQEENPTPNPPEQNPSTTENQTNLNLTPLMIAATIPTILIAITIGTTLYKRKRKH